MCQSLPIFFLICSEQPLFTSFHLLPFLCIPCLFPAPWVGLDHGVRLGNAPFIPLQQYHPTLPVNVMLSAQDTCVMGPISHGLLLLLHG